MMQDERVDTAGERARRLQRRYSAAYLLLAAALTLFGTWLDRESGLVYGLRWFFAFFVVAFAVMGIAFSIDAGRAVLASVLIGWGLLLPLVRWGAVKPLYMDCMKIGKGMSVGEARQIMAAHHLQNVAAGRDPIRTELDHPHLTFHPMGNRSADWCVVFTEGDTVSSVEPM